MIARWFDGLRWWAIRKLAGRWQVAIGVRIINGGLVVYRGEVLKSRGIIVIGAERAALSIGEEGKT